MKHRRKRRNKKKPQLIDRYLELDEIYAVLDAISEYPIQNDKQPFQATRARYIILLLFYIRIRIIE